MKKFELTDEFITNEFGNKLYRIKALVDFGNVKAGELGGYIEKEGQLSQDGNAWVYGDAKVYGDAWVCGDADYSTIKGFGSVYRTTTFFRTKNGGVSVLCGCFYGTLREFRNEVTKTHGEGKTAKEYLMIADSMEYHFLKEEDAK